MSLSQNEVHEVAGLLGGHIGPDQRGLLLRDLEPGVIARLKIFSTPFDQVVSDITTLISMKPRAGEYLAAKYLRNGAAQLAGRPGTERLQALADRVDRGPVTVLYMNARSPAPWKTIYPGARGIDLTEPDGAWHKITPPGSSEWHAALDAIDRGLDQVPRQPGRIAVFASTGYALGAWLGNRVQQIAQAHVHFHQLTGSRGPAAKWADYGPAGGDSVYPDPVLVDRGTRKSDDPRHHALVWEITHEGIDSQIEHGLKDFGRAGATIERLGMPRPGRDAVPDDRATIDRIVVQLEHSVERACARPEVEMVHLFYIGPLAVMMRAADRFNTLPRPLVIHERGADKMFRPALRVDGDTARLLGE